jgi:hypothetical protein
MEHVNILEAARRCGVSDKTIRRAIHKGLLPARFPRPNRCEIALSDLERFAPGQTSGHVQVSVEERIATLERRVQGLEQRVQEWLDRPEAVTPRHVSRRETRTTGPFPRHLVSLLAFAQLHSVPETKVQTHASRDMTLLPVKRGEWIDHDGTVVKEALDAKGRKVFYQLYCELPYFLRCDQCPHGYLDTV